MHVDGLLRSAEANAPMASDSGVLYDAAPQVG